jgi:hypothetical protein
MKDNLEEKLRENRRYKDHNPLLTLSISKYSVGQELDL